MSGATETKHLPRLTVFNAKGGTGKTAIALNLALTYGYNLITNDRLSIVDEVLEPDRFRILNKSKTLPRYEADTPIVYDFGGFPDKRILKAFEESAFVIVPVLPGFQNMQINLNIIAEIVRYIESGRLVVVVNQTQDRQFEEAELSLRNFFPELNIFNFKKSAAFAWMVEHHLSIRELADTFKLQRRHFTPVADQFDELASFIGIK